MSDSIPYLALAAGIVGAVWSWMQPPSGKYALLLSFVPIAGIGLSIAFC